MPPSEIQLSVPLKKKKQDLPLLLSKGCQRQKARKAQDKQLLNNACICSKLDAREAQKNSQISTIMVKRI